MSTRESIVSQYFGQDQATAYDERWAKFAPIREALSFLTRTVLAILPPRAKVLCVGVGTGSELIDLARAFPEWQFTAVEPSAPMLNVCRKKVNEAGLGARCQFHEGYLDSLPPTEPFDAATSLLVSQFLIDQEQRREFFRHIARRLRPGAYLINADLASSLPSPAFEGLFEVWLRFHTGSLTPATTPSSMGWGKDVAVLAPHEIEAIMTASGFEHPTSFYQALFVHAWYARVPSGVGSSPAGKAKTHSLR